MFINSSDINISAGESFLGEDNPKKGVLNGRQFAVIHPNEESDIIQDIVNIPQNMTMNQISTDTKIGSSAVPLVKRKKRKKKQKNKAKNVERLQGPWRGKNKKILEKFGYYDQVSLQHLPVWIQNILGNQFFLGGSIGFFVLSELSFMAVEILGSLKTMPVEEGNIKSFFLYLPESFYFLQKIICSLSIKEDVKIEIDNFSLFEGMMNKLIPLSFMQINKKIIQFSEEIHNSDSRSYIKNKTHREKIRTRLEGMLPILDGILKLTDMPSSNSSLELFRTQTCQLVRQEHNLFSVPDCLDRMNETYQRIFSFLNHNNRVILNWISFDQYEKMKKNINNCSKRVSKIKLKQEISYQDILVLECALKRYESLVRVSLGYAINVIHTKGMGREQMVVDLFNLPINDSLGIFSYVFNSEEFVANWYMLIIRSIRSEFEKNVFFINSMKYQLLTKEGYRFSSERFQQFLTTCDEFFEELQQINLNARVLNDKEDGFISIATGSLSVLDILEQMEDEYALMNEVVLESPGSWFILTEIYHCYFIGNVERYFPYILTSQMNSLKRRASQLKNRKGEDKHELLEEVLHSINLIAQIMEIAEKYHEPLNLKGNEMLSFREKTKVIQNQLVSRNSKKKKKQHPRTKKKRAFEPIASASPKSLTMIIEEQEDSLIDRYAGIEIKEVDLCGDIDEEKLIENEINMIEEIVEKCHTVLVNTEFQENKTVTSEKTYSPLFNVTFKELVKELQSAGWRLIRGTKGGHAQFKHPEHTKLGRFSLPCHGNNGVLSPGVVKEARKRMHEITA